MDFLNKMWTISEMNFSICRYLKLVLYKRNIFIIMVNILLHVPTNKSIFKSFDSRYSFSDKWVETIQIFRNSQAVAHCDLIKWSSAANEVDNCSESCYLIIFSHIKQENKIVIACENDKQRHEWHRWFRCSPFLDWRFRLFIGSLINYFMF